MVVCHVDTELSFWRSGPTRQYGTPVTLRLNQIDAILSVVHCYFCDSKPSISSSETFFSIGTFYSKISQIFLFVFILRSSNFIAKVILLRNASSNMVT